MTDIDTQELQSLVETQEILEPRETEITWTNDQQKLLDWFDSFLQNQNINDPSIATIQGSAGTGKTYTICEIVKRALQAQPHRSWYRVGVMAPTNKAVSVLAAKLLDYGFNLDYAIFNDDGKCYDPNRVYVGTIHKFLRAIPNSGNSIEPDDDELSFDLSADKEEMPINRMNLVIIDESSMINDQFFQLIINSISPTAILLFTGDMFQLFPVDNSYSVARPFVDVSNVIQLKEVVRYSGETLRVATVLRDNMEDGLVNRPYSFKRYDLPELAVIKDKNGYNGTEWYERLLSLCEKQRDEQLPADFVRALVYKRNTRELLNTQIRSDLYGIDAQNRFIDGEWLFTHSVGSSFISMETRTELLRLKDEQDPEAELLQKEIADQLIRIGNAKDLKIRECQSLEVVLPCPTSDLDPRWPKLVQPYTIIDAQLGNMSVDVGVLTAPQLAQFARNKHQIIRTLDDFGYSSAIVHQYLRQLSNCFNVTEQPTKYVKENEQQYCYHNLGLTGFPSNIRVSSKIQPGFTLTVHQSQGSTINNAFVMYSDFFTYHPEVSEEDRNALLYRLLYTALTRAKDSAVVFSKY